MKFLFVFALAVACARADVSHLVHSSGDVNAVVLKSGSDVQPDGFNYEYETSNNIYAAASGVIKNPNSDTPTQEVKGEYKYVGPDGVTYSVTYISDENGYQPQGAHLPVPPPVPEAIQRSLAYIAANPQPESKYVVPQPSVHVYKPSVQPVYKPGKAFGKLF